MYYFPMYYDNVYSWLIFIIPPLLISIYAQVKLKSTYSKYEKTKNSKGYNAAVAARTILDNNGLNDVRIVKVAGNLTDHFDPKTKTVSLSETTYNSDSIAAIGVAAHEVGHAIQYKEEYTPMKIRGAIIPATNIGSTLSFPLLIFGIIFSIDFLIYFGIALFSLVFIFQLVTLPVEFNASHRALVALKEGLSMQDEEVSGAKKVLSAAAMTYVAAMLTALAQLLRLLLLSRRND